MPSYQYRKSHCGHKTTLLLSNLHNRIYCTGVIFILNQGPVFYHVNFPPYVYHPGTWWSVWEPPGSCRTPSPDTSCDNKARPPPPDGTSVATLPTPHRSHTHYKQCHHQVTSWEITYRGLMTHICVSKLGHRWFRQWLVTCSASSHYLNQWWLIKRTLRNYVLVNLFQ